MILIYCPEENPRVTWTFDLVFKQLLGLDYRLTTFPEELSESEGARLNYSFKPVEGIPFIEASGLLFETDIRDQSQRLIPGHSWHGLPVIFAGQSPDSPVPFDLFSAVFYFVSRYEEYLPFEPDEHHRFRSTESLAFHLNILERPVVNLWVLQLGEILKGWYGTALTVRNPDYRHIPTIDIDNAWAYAHKGWVRTMGGLWNDRRDMEAQNFRFQVMRNNQPDPYNTYELIQRFHREAGAKPIWFFLLARHGHFDRNVSPGNSHYRRLIKNIASSDAVGIHPSYASNSSPDRIREEIGHLSAIVEQPVIRSRQHYLRIQLPDTYRTLAQLGILEDYSMGFADRPGFRAGIASPFRFFDLEDNRPTALQIYPFQVMDTSLRQYLNLTPDQAEQKISTLVYEVKKAHGTFISLWHNESLSEWKHWTGWSRVYRELLALAKPV